MKIEIDQSGRIEYTSASTVIADSVGNSILLKSVDKQYIQKVFRSVGKPKRFVIETFSFLVAVIILKSYAEGNLYVIDTEYPGKDNDIKTYLFRFLTRLNCTLTGDSVSFAQIGKKSKAHEVAYGHYSNPRLYPYSHISKDKVLSFVIQKRPWVK